MSGWPLVKLAERSTHQGTWQPKDGNKQSQRPSAISQGSIGSVLTHLGRSLTMASASSVKKPKNLKPGFCPNPAKITPSGPTILGVATQPRQLTVEALSVIHRGSVQSVLGAAAPPFAAYPASTGRYPPVMGLDDHWSSWPSGAHIKGRGNLRMAMHRLRDLKPSLKGP